MMRYVMMRILAPTVIQNTDAARAFIAPPREVGRG